MYNKLGVIVPYRKRFGQLQRFLQYVPKYLQKQELDYEIIVAEQMDEEDFNRGALLNAGFLEAKKRGCDYVVFHDVDLLPRNVDYTYSNTPLELVEKIVDPREDKHFQINVADLTDDYFGGVTMFTVEDFEKINGYSNKYVGWGFEDNDLLLRCREAQIPLGYKNYRQYPTLEPAFTFNGHSSYIKVPFLSKLKKDSSFLVTFRVEDLETDINLPHDECAIFCIPGLDIALSYESFGTYKFEAFDTYEDAYSIHTKKYPIGITIQAVVTLDTSNNKATLYMNGKNIGTFKWPEGRRLKFSSNEIYLGVGHPTREIESNSSRKWFKGQISEFATFSRVLSPKEIKDLYRNSYLGLNRFKPYQWYSAKVTEPELTGVPNLGRGVAEEWSEAEMVDTTIEPLVSLEEFYKYTVPLKRSGIFVSQPHITAGTVQGYWKSWATRLNQFRYRDAETFGTFKSRDGLSNFSKVAKTTVKQMDICPEAVHVQVNFLRK